ncbi:hypothetical protein TNIN_475861 [Trichonephila inaurata madagascariensis]|uniref:Uncharacterized protein n=1 Tax=Trichonephila inaurata madagascariensis TaxID=2747483 RepID=A0A8X7BZT4_9ARAC|nr:hypothetical protein TNIN_475861 [Trichonephila inaurata madagascariensis]
MKLAKLNNTSLNDIREQPDISDLPFPHFIILEPDDSHREQRPENPTSRQIYRLVSLNQLLMLIRIASESIKVLAQSNKRNPRVESCVIQELVWGGREANTRRVRQNWLLGCHQKFVFLKAKYKISVSVGRPTFGRWLNKILIR